MEKKLVKMIADRIPQPVESKTSNSRSRSNSKSTGTVWFNNFLDRGIKKKSRENIASESDSDTFK